MMSKSIGLLIYILLFGLFNCYMGSDGSPDSRIYHLYNGYVAASGGRPQDIAAAGMQTYFYPGLDLLYHHLIWALNSQPRLLQFILGIPYALAAWLVWRIGVMLLPADWPRRDALAAIFALFGMTGAAGLATIGTMMSEVIPGLPILAGLAVWLYTRERQQIGWLALAGCLAGLSVGLKLTILPMFIGLFIAVLASTIRSPARALRCGLVFGSAGVAASFVVAGPWLLHNWQAYGNPIFPNFNDVFRSDLVTFARWDDNRFKPQGLFQILFYPAFWAFHESNAAIELNMRDARILMVLLAAIVLLVRRSANFNARILSLFLIVSYFLWEYQFSILRYLTILECLSGVLFLAAVAALVPRRFALPASIAALIIAGTAAYQTKYPWWSRATPGPLAVNVALPPIAPDAMVIFLDPYAYSYIVPLMPPTVRVVGANTNLIRPGSAGRLQAQAETAINSHQGPLWGLDFSAAFPGAADATLRFYQLSRVAETCGVVPSNLEDGPHVRLCRLERKSLTQKALPRLDVE